MEDDVDRISVFEQPFRKTDIVRCNADYSNNDIYIKRDDLLPFSFGGNKVRKARHFYQEIIKLQSDYVVTYGSSSSNHCRIIANMACAMGIPCHIISPQEHYRETSNSRMIHKMGATVETCPISEVSTTIDNRLKVLQEKYNPYFIMGGGHGNPGTAGYVEAYQEILDYEIRNNLQFDIICFASGTGTTQAGLIIGQLLQHRDNQIIIGFSIARTNSGGIPVITESIQTYLQSLLMEKQINEFEYREYKKKSENKIIFTDEYRLGGYGDYDTSVIEMIRKVLLYEAIPMDTTYVGKAFTGMVEYLKKNEIENKKILFIHTGGTPLFFDNNNM